MRAQITRPVRRLLDVLPGAGPRVADPVRAAADAAAAGCLVALEYRPAAERRCRTPAAGRVRLTAGRGAAADLAFVRCLNVLMSGAGYPAVGSTDPRLVAIAGERAAWNDRDPDSWEYVMPWQVRSEQQRRSVAGGYRVRVVLRSGGRS